MSCELFPWIAKSALQISTFNLKTASVIKLSKTQGSAHNSVFFLSAHRQADFQGPQFATLMSHSRRVVRLTNAVIQNFHFKLCKRVSSDYFSVELSNAQSHLHTLFNLLSSN